MALELGALRDALTEAGASNASAKAAAEELAGYSDQIASIKTHLGVLIVMVGGVYALLGPAVWLLLRIGAKTGALG